MPLTDFQTLVDNKIRDEESRIATADRDTAIGNAVLRYSVDRPQTKVEDLVSAGGHYLDLPAAWEDGFSALLQIEFPIGEYPPELLDNSGWSLYQSPSGQQIFLRDALTNGDSVRATYTIQHQVDANTDTTPAKDREAIACWAAALLCDQLASYYSGESNPTIQADAVQHSDTSRRFASRAKGFREQYFNELGIDPKRNVAAGVVVDLDLKNSLGLDRLTHPRRYR